MFIVARRETARTPSGVQRGDSRETHFTPNGVSICAGPMSTNMQPLRGCKAGLVQPRSDTSELASLTQGDATAQKVLSFGGFLGLAGGGAAEH
jgi:hypothetical protein